MDNQDFYKELPVNNIGLSKLFLRPHLFYDVPADWHIVVTDVESSSAAVAEGRHEDINLIATGSVVAVLNISHEQSVVTPFFFGGDGATFLLPHTLLKPAIAALQTHSANISKSFNLRLRVGTVPVSELYEQKISLKISKAHSTTILEIPVILGDGLAYAEEKIKGADYMLSPLKSDKHVLNLDGMECRWDVIPPPDSHEEVISLLVIALQESDQGKYYNEVCAFLDKIYGDIKTRNSISLSKLKLAASVNRITNGMKIKMKRSMFVSVVSEWFTILAAKLYLKTSKGKKYLATLIELTDNLVLDGKINTVISGTKQQRATLEKELKVLEQQGHIYYGIHHSSASIMSCYVRDLEQNHIHFIDGSQGGYTAAAAEIKRKIRDAQIVSKN